MGIFYREKTFHAGKKIRKNDFVPSEKYGCYAPGQMPCHPPWLRNSIDVMLFFSNPARGSDVK